MSVEIKIEDNSPLVLDALTDVALRGLEQIGMAAEGYAKDLCPVDTGNLRNSITHLVDDAEGSVLIGTNVEYGPYVELGTSKMAAQPYLKPAASEHGQTYRNILEAELKNG